MSSQNLRSLLKQTDDKLSLFTNRETLKKYQMSVGNLLNLISDFLSDEEILRLFDYPQFMNAKSWLKAGIIGLISDGNILLQILYNDNIIDGLDNYKIGNIIKNMGDNEKKQLLYNQEFMEKHQITSYEVKNIILSLSDETRTEILSDIDLTKNKLGFENYEIAKLVTELSSEDVRKEILQIYNFENHLKVDIIITFSNISKLDILKEESGFSKYDKIRVLQSLDVEALSDFFENNRVFCSNNNIHPYEITSKLDSERLRSFVVKLEEISLTSNEKKEILAMLKSDVKQSIDTTNLPEEYKTALSIETTEYGGIVNLDFERDLEDYRGLDNLLRINPENFTEEQRNKFLMLCDICPNLNVVNTLNNSIEFFSTATEYKEQQKRVKFFRNKIY